MSTIRIYKVAEVLGLPSQEVIDLLKREHGIEVKSASSTIEEIVARQFAERTARDRDLNLPTGRLFSETTASSSRSRAGKKGAKTPQPTMRPRLGPPRLVKTPQVEPSVAERPSGGPSASASQPPSLPVQSDVSQSFCAITQ